MRAGSSMLEGRFGHERQIDEWRRQLGGFGDVHQITMQQHRRTDPDGEARDGSDDRLVRVCQRFDKGMGRKLVAGARSRARKISKIISWL